MADQVNTGILFSDADGEPLRFFLPMSLTSRGSFKEKIERNGGVLVQSELMTNIIKIGDPAKPQSYDASWLNFRYIDDAIKTGQLQDPEFYVMQNHGSQIQLLRVQDTMPITTRETPTAGELPNGVGSRGTRTEFTPEEDDVLRRIVHRPGVATSGNKIYQLIAQQYGGHSFHSWRDRYIRHMRPIWGPPTEETAMDVNATDDFILTQSYLRAPHVSTSERADSKAQSASVAPEGSHVSQEDLITPATPPAMKKQRAAFSTTDDEILLRAIVEKGETASTFKMLGSRHPHHTWESWKNRVKALKKRNNGTLPDPDQTLGFADMSDLSASNIDMTMVLEAQSPQNLKVEAMHQGGEHLDEQQAGADHDILQASQQHQSHEQEVVDPNIDPNLQQLHLSMIMDDPNQEAFEQQFSETGHYGNLDLDMQQRLQEEEDDAGSPFSYAQSTEEMLRQNLQGHVSAEFTGSHELPQTKRRGAARQSAPGRMRQGKRKINIHDPLADENVGPVSDIEDETQLTGKRPKRAAKKRKTNAAAQAAAARAAAVTRATPATPSRQQDEPMPSNPKSAKQEHHEREKPGLVKAVREDAMPGFIVQVPEPRTRAAMARAASQEPQPLAPGMRSKGRPWSGDHDNVAPSETMNNLGADLSDDDLRAAEQIKRNTYKRQGRVEPSGVEGLPQVDENNFLQSNVLLQNFGTAPRSVKGRKRREVRATPDSSPVRPPVSQIRATMVDQDGNFTTNLEPPSPTPASPPKAYTQIQFLQDTQAIHEDMNFDFDPTIHEMELDSQEEAQYEEYRAADELRKANWIERQARTYGIQETDAEDAWNRTSGVQSLAVKVVKAYSEGIEPPRLPGIWSEEDDRIIRSTDAAAMDVVDAFHNGAVESRLLFLHSIGQSFVLE